MYSFRTICQNPTMWQVFPDRHTFQHLNLNSSNAAYLSRALITKNKNRGCHALIRFGTFDTPQSYKATLRTPCGEYSLTKQVDFFLPLLLPNLTNNKSSSCKFWSNFAPAQLYFGAVGLFQHRSTWRYRFNTKLSIEVIFVSSFPLQLIPIRPVV